MTTEAIPPSNSSHPVMAGALKMPARSMEGQQMLEMTKDRSRLVSTEKCPRLVKP